MLDIPQEVDILDSENAVTPNTNQSFCETIDPEEEEEITTRELWIKATIVDTLCDISHQHIVFPETPCGSYSIMNIHLRAFKDIFDVDCNCGYLKKFSKGQKVLNYDVKYRIFGGNQEIFIQPTCGTLKAGEVKINETKNTNHAYRVVCSWYKILCC